MDESESKSAHEINISVNKSEVKDTKYEEPPVTYHSVINSPVYFKMFKCGKELFRKLYVTDECAYLSYLKDEYWTEMCDAITNYNERNHTPLSNANII